MSEDTPDFARLDDSALISRRVEMRAELERLPPHSPGHDALTRAYDASTEEIDARARGAWTHSRLGRPVDDMTRARMLVGVDLLLADPESLGNDALEGDLYILRDQLTGQATKP